MKNQNNIFKVGCFIGIIMIITGIVIICCAPQGLGIPHSNCDYPEYARFYGLYETYQYEVTSIAAENVADVSYGVVNLMKALAVLFGISFVFAGVLTLLHYLRLMGISAMNICVNENIAEEKSVSDEQPINVETESAADENTTEEIQIENQAEDIENT